MTPNYLKKVLPLLLDADLAKAANVRLVSLAKAFAAVYELVSSAAPAGEYGAEGTCRDRIGCLFDVLSERLACESDTVVRSRMVHAMYSLACETVFAVDLRKKECCYRAADALVRDYMNGIGTGSGNGLLQQAGICMCAADLLYPAPAADDEYLLFLKRQIAGWIAEMNRDGSWNGVSPDVALERVGMMNRYSCMLFDRTNDKAVKRSFEYFRNSLPVPEDTGNFDENYLHTLGRLYDAAILGNAYDMDHRLAHRIARFMYDYSRTPFCSGDDRFYCTSYVIHCVVEEIGDRIQNKFLLNIA